jgi:hypothetical protein
MPGTCNKCGGVGHWARECPSTIDLGRGGTGGGGGRGGGGNFQSGGRGGGAGAGRDAPRDRRQPGAGDTCNKCGQVGHWARECPNAEVGEGRPERRQPGATDTCNKCGKVGHWARECPEGAAAGGSAGGRGKKGGAGDTTMDASGLDNDLDSYFSGRAEKPAGEGGDAAPAEEMAA